MDTSIIRKQTEEEKRDFESIAKKKDAKSIFNKELGKEQQIALKAGIPFAEKVARDDFNDYYEAQAKLSMRKNGYVDISEIKPLKIEWDKYSDLKNFEVVDEKEVFDDNLTRRNPGKNIMIKCITYKYKGYSNTYKVMEDPQTAIARSK